MDAVINGEVSEEPAEKEKREEKNVTADADSKLVSCDSKIESECQENSSPHSSHLPKTISSNSDESLPQNITDGDINVPQNKSSDDGSDESKKNEIEQLPTAHDSISEFSDVKSSEKDCDDESSLTDKESGESLVSDKQESKDPILTPETMDEDEIISETKSSDKMLLCEKSVKSDKVEEKVCESSTNSINLKSESCHELLNNSNDSVKENNPDKNASCDLLSNLLPNKSDDHLSEICHNSVNHGSHELPSDAKNCDQVSSEDSNLLSSAANISHIEQSNNLSASESKLPNTDSVTVGVSNNSNPLEQLNQHIKTISSKENKINDNFSKIDQNFNANKVESSKVCLKEDGDRHKEKESNCFVFTEISKEDTGFPEVFAGLVVIGKYLSVKGDFTLRSSEALVESPSLTSPYLVKEPDNFPPRLNDSKLEPKDFFHSTAGELLIGIGLSRVNEWYQRDMTRIKKRQMKREGKSPQLEGDLKLHESCYNEAKKANRIYSFTLKTCKTCGFATESSIVMEGHLLIPHVTPRREFQCNFCEIFNRDPKAMLEHMYRIHGKTGRIQPPLLFFECPYCTFESNSKVKLGNHLIKCQRMYDPSRNQAPPKDFDFPALTPKPITVAVVKAYEKSLCSMQRGRGRPKKIDTIAEQMNLNQFSSSINHTSIVASSIPPYRASSTTPLSENIPSMSSQIMPPIQMSSMNVRPPTHPNLGQLRSPLPSMHLPSPNRFYQMVGSSPLMPMMGNSPLVTTPSQFPFSSHIVNTNNLSKKLQSPQHIMNSFFGSNLRQQNPTKSVPEVTITPLPKLQGPYPVPIAKPSSTPANSSSSSQSNSLVVCEICDGYIKDLEQLRSHMQLIHKVKIHPKMLVSRPPLNCQKCQWRFFTDQGLERHLLGAHGLVTSNMQELANKGKDAGCCTICGRVYASKLVTHMNQVHKLTLKPAHLSYKCTVCSATFNLYRLFENHVYLVHSGAAKRPSDGSSNSSKKIKSLSGDGDSHLENDPKNHMDKRTTEENLSRCVECGMQFKKQAAQIDKCGKCLKCGVSQGTLSSKMS